MRRSYLQLMKVSKRITFKLYLNSVVGSFEQSNSTLLKCRGTGKREGVRNHLKFSDTTNHVFGSSNAFIAYVW